MLWVGGEYNSRQKEKAPTAIISTKYGISFHVLSLRKENLALWS
jgi:hypothetical protein